MKYQSARPYAAALVMLKRADGKIAFVLRSSTAWMNGFYGLPAGKVEENESFRQAAIREAYEEAGVVLKPKNLHHVVTCHRLASDENRAWLDMLFEASEWEGDVTNAEPDHHSEIAWFALDALPENVVPPIRSMLAQAQAGHTYCEYGWETE